MELSDIRKKALSMQTKVDLLELINTIRKDEQEHYHPYTINQLWYFCNPNHGHRRYREFKIPKKSGGMRNIAAPASVTYMQMLQCTSMILQSVYVPSTHTMGFCQGRSIVDNAMAHVGMNYVFNIDLKDFFPSIERARIVARLQVRPFCFSEEVALAIAGLCCMRIKDNAEENAEKRYRYVLPQGSPASPVLTNLMCDKLDYQLSGVSKRFGVHYTRYADDITFSSMHNVYQEGSRFRMELERIITAQGFTMNEKKTRLNKIGARQEVTGLTVSQSKVNVARTYIRELRGMLYIWEKYGYMEAEHRLHIHNASNRLSRKKGVSLVCVLEGKLMFLKMVKGKEDSTYQGLNKRFNLLLEKQNKVQPMYTDLVYRETSVLSRFEEKIQTQIVFPAEGYRTSFEYQGQQYAVTIQKTVDVNTSKDKLMISLCESKDGRETFYMIHPPYVSQYTKNHVDIDALNKDLNDLLQLDNTEAKIICVF